MGHYVGVEEQASIRFLVSGGQVKIQVEAAEHVISLEVSEAELTSAFLLRTQGWSNQFRARLRISRPFRAAAPGP